MRKSNITLKFIGYLIIFTIVPLLALGLVSVRVATQVLTDEYRNFTAKLVRNEQEYLDLQLEQVESLIANISGVEEITNALSDTGSSDAYTNLATQARIGYILNGYLNLRGLVSIEIFTVGGNHYHVGDTLNIDNIQDDIKDKIYTETLESNKNILWVGIEDNVNGNSVHEKVLVAAKILRHTNRETLEQEPVGLLLVNYSTDDFHEHYDQINIGEDAYFMVVDTKGRIIYHPDYDNLGAKVNQSFLDKLDSETGILTTDIGGVSTFVTYTKSARSDWYILSLVPVHIINEKTKLIRIMVFSLLMLGLTFIAFSAYLISKNLVTPIRQVTNQFKQFQEGKLDYSTRLKPSSDDEIGQLVVWFNAFVESLAAYEEAKKQLSDSEERYALALKGANDGLWDWDLLSNEIYLSQRWKQILGYKDDEIGTNPDEWLGRIHPDCRVQVQTKLDGHIQGKTAHFESEHRLRHKDNTYRWVLARGLVLFNENGIAYRMAGSHTEITIRKQTEEKLRRDAFYDILTGLPNRALFADRLDKAIQRTKRTPEAQFAVLFLDLDHFKLVNDSLGHNNLWC